MSDYRRVYVESATYFFTVVTHGRRPLFALEAIVVLPDHLHCLWRMTGDSNFSVRWQMIKTRFSRGSSAAKGRDGGKRLWQPRFWEHLIRDQADLHRHQDYIHYNPVRHGYVDAPADWPHSSFARFVARGWYAPDWGASEPISIRGMDLE